MKRPYSKPEFEIHNLSLIDDFLSESPDNSDDEFKDNVKPELGYEGGVLW